MSHHSGQRKLISSFLCSAAKEYQNCQHESSCPATFYLILILQLHYFKSIKFEVVYDCYILYFHFYTSREYLLHKPLCQGYLVMDVPWQKLHHYNDLFAASSKYNYELKQNPKGLTVFSVEQSDAGIYECRAEVISEGALRVRTITLDVLCRSN